MSLSIEVCSLFHNHVASYSNSRWLTCFPPLSYWTNILTWVFSMTDRYNNKGLLGLGGKRIGGLWMYVFLNGFKGFLPIFIPHLWFSIRQRITEDGFKNGGYLVINQLMYCIIPKKPLINITIYIYINNLNLFLFTNKNKI